MIFVLLLALSGGLFAIFTLIHFLTDWVLQTHAEAMVKHNNPKVRAKHCVIYTLGFVPLLLVFVHVGALTLLQFTISIAILFFSHFYLDTYHAVFLWAKYIRKPPEMSGGDKKIGFFLFVQTALGKILMITIDQLSHLVFLLPIVWMVMDHLSKILFQ